VRFRIALFSLTLAVLGPVSADAHDFWIELSSFRPNPNAVVSVRLKVGEDFAGDPVRRRGDRIVKFVAVTRDGERPVAGLEGSDPAGLVRLTDPGAALIAYRSHHSHVELPAEKFERYLKEEGLERIIQLRRQLGRDREPGRELFSRCAVALLRVQGDPIAGHSVTPAGLRFELVPERDPSAATSTAPLPVRVLYEGRPVANVLVVAMRKDQPARKLTARSDASGRVTLRVDAGIWLLKAVHMVQAPPESKADWESLWASLTFEVPYVRIDRSASSTRSN
jgi:uncharacterized GH25 family protein